MEILVFLCVISHLNLVLTDDNVAIDSTVTQRSTYKVHPDPEDVGPLNDQVAESSQPISQSYSHVVLGSSQTEIPVVSQSHHQLAQDGQNVQQAEPLSPEASRQNSVEVHVNHGYTQHPQEVYVHHYPMQPIRILDAETSPLRQIHGKRNENENPLGYSSYVEHVSHKDEEEIHSALKDGSVNDIKRLVPKSGISFKIYHDEKNANPSEKPEVQPNVATTIVQPKIPGGYLQHHSRLHHRIKEVPATQLSIQTTAQHDQQATGLEGLHQTLEQQQHLLQSVGKSSFSHDQQSVNGQTVYYTQPEIHSPKTFLEINGKVKPHVKINVDHSGYGKASSSVEFNSLTGSKAPKHGLSDYGDVQYQKQWAFDSKTESSQKALKTLTPVTKLHYEIDPFGQHDRVRGYHYTQNHPTGAIGVHVGQNNYNKPKGNSFVENSKIGGNVNYLSNSYLTKGTQSNFAGHLVNKGHIDQKPAHAVLNRLTGTYINADGLKTGQNHIISHLGTTALGDSELLKGGQHFATHSYSDSEAAKSGQHDILGHVVQNAYVDAKHSQNTFDHQKALEGSTSFDIKNAIDSTGSLVHQTNYETTTDAHALEELHKQQIAYIIPKIPTQTVLFDNDIHEAVEGHHVKDFGHAGQLSYHAVSSPDLSGKFLHQPQTILWTSEPVKQGNAFTANDLQHSNVIKLHLPKEEIYKHVKAPNVHLPTSVSHIPYTQHKQPYLMHYDLPVLKYPQEIHFQPKTKTRIQANHINLPQPVTIDWSLFKSTLPHVQTLSVKPELATHVHEPLKKIVPILVRKRKNRSNSNQEVGVVYGKVNNNRRPTIPTHRQEKNIRVNLLSEASNNVKQYEPKGDRQNEFSVSASYKVDRSFNGSDGS